MMFETMKNENIKISTAHLEDLAEILHLQKRAFITEAEMHGNYDIEPLTQTYESILSDFNSYVFLKAMCGDKIIGSVKYRVLEDKVWIGKLIVDIECRRQGLGRRLLKEVEKANPESEKFQLFTAATSTHNIRLYESVGYHVYRQYQDNKQSDLLMVEMIKIRNTEMGVMETERLILRPIVESDAEAIFEYCKNENVGPNAGWKPHADMEETREVMKTVFLYKENVFGIELKEAKKIIGSIGLVPDPKRQNESTRMLGYAIGEDYWGKGYTTEAAQALITFGFEQLELDLISAYCYPFNERSKRVIEKCGFKHEGLLRLAEKRYDGEVLDNECFSIIRADL